MTWQKMHVALGGGSAAPDWPRSTLVFWLSGWLVFAGAASAAISGLSMENMFELEFVHIRDSTRPLVQSIMRSRILYVY